MIPVNFITTQVNQIIDCKSQKSLLITVDLIIVAMLNSNESIKYIENIMNNLSEKAKDDIQVLIERSKNNIDDLISSRQSEADILEDSVSASDQRHRASRVTGSGISLHKKDFLAIPEDAREDNPDSARNNKMDDMAGDLLGSMLRDDNSDNLLGGNLINDDGLFSDNKSAQLGN